MGHEQHQLNGSSFTNNPTREEKNPKHGGKSKRISSSGHAGGGLTQQPGNHNPHNHHQHRHHRHHNRHRAREDVNEMGSRSCWDWEGVVRAYRGAAADTVRRLSSALFGEELLAIEAAKAVAAEREKMLQAKAREMCESQVRTANMLWASFCRKYTAIATR